MIPVMVFSLLVLEVIWSLNVSLLSMNTPMSFFRFPVGVFPLVIQWVALSRGAV